MLRRLLADRCRARQRLLLQHGFVARRTPRGIRTFCSCESQPEGSFWEADHIVPVVAGGGQCGLLNFRTLCVPCHREATAKLTELRKRGVVGKRARSGTGQGTGSSSSSSASSSSSSLSAWLVPGKVPSSGTTGGGSAGGRTSAGVVDLCISEDGDENEDESTTGPG